MDPPRFSSKPNHNNALQSSLASNHDWWLQLIDPLNACFLQTTDRQTDIDARKKDAGVVKEEASESEEMSGKERRRRQKLANKEGLLCAVSIIDLVDWVHYPLVICLIVSMTSLQALTLLTFVARCVEIKQMAIILAPSLANLVRLSSGVML